MNMKGGGRDDDEDDDDDGGLDVSRTHHPSTRAPGNQPPVCFSIYFLGGRAEVTES